MPTNLSSWPALGPGWTRATRRPCSCRSHWAPARPHSSWGRSTVRKVSASPACSSESLRCFLSRPCSALLRVQDGERRYPARGSVCGCSPAGDTRVGACQPLPRDAPAAGPAHTPVCRVPLPARMGAQLCQGLDCGPQQRDGAGVAPWLLRHRECFPLASVLALAPWALPRGSCFPSHRSPSAQPGPAGLELVPEGTGELNPLAYLVPGPQSPSMGTEPRCICPQGSS